MEFPRLDTVVVLMLLNVFSIICGVEGESFFQGSCEKWNPCSHMCINLKEPQTGDVYGLECRCARGYLLRTDGFSCDHIPPIENNSNSPEIEELGSLETPHFVKIHHNPDTSNNKLTGHLDDSLEDDKSAVRGSNINALDSSENSRDISHTDSSEVVVQDLDALNDDNHLMMQRDDPAVQHPDLTVAHKDETSGGTKKKWSYNNPYNNHPQTYYNANSHRKEYYNYAGNVVRVPSEEVKSREKAKSRGKNGRRKGGRKGNKGRNKSRKVDLDSEQADSADLGNLKYQEELSNSVLEEDLKSKGEFEAPFTKPVEFENCDSLKCKSGGRCTVDELRGGVRCQCRLGTQGKFCENEVMVKYPQFIGTGYMAFPVLRDAYKEFTVTMEFRPDTSNGLLLFSSEQPTAKTDFFSVALVDQKVEFRFDCGSGAAIIMTRNKVVLGDWNTIVVHRKDWSGSIQLNDGSEYRGKSKGFFKRITFREDLYIGGYRNLSLIGEETSSTGRQWGFVGCIRRLEVNDKVYDMRKGPYVGDALHGADVGECSAHTCDHVDCLNGGRCQADSADTSVCLCPFGAAGDRCETKIDIEIPSFDGSSYLQFLGLRRKVLIYTKIELTFKPVEKDGLLLYNGFRTDRTGDYISVAMVDGHLEFRFDLGTGPAIVRSSKLLSLNEWHTAHLERTGKLGTMVVDKEKGVSASSKGGYTQLTLTLDLFIGGHRNFDEVSKSANIQTSFKGCIQKLVINDSPIELVDEYITGANINNCHHLCNTRPCLNGGNCIPLYERYECSCSLGFESDHCEQRKVRFRYRFKREIRNTVTVPMFNGKSYLLYEKEHSIIQRIRGSKFDIQLRLRVTNPDGLILWAGEEPMGASSDYIALGVDHGHAIMRFNLGSGDLVVSYNNSRIDDGKWHTIRAQRYKSVGILGIDGSKVVEGTSPGPLQQLNVGENLYIGGMPVGSISESTLYKFAKGFEGCISSLKLGGDYNVKLMDEAENGQNISQCDTEEP